MSIRRIAPAVMAVLGLAAAAAHADLTAEVNNGDKISSSISPATEIETFTVTVPAGALLSVKAKGKGKKGPAVALSVSQPGDVIVPGVVEAGTAASLKKYEVPSSGVYTVQVTSRDGVATGDYGLKITWKTPPKVQETRTLSDPGSVLFTADAGATVSVKAVAGKGSAVVPVVRQITGPDGFLQTFGAAGKAASDKTPKLTVPTTGDYRVQVADDAGAGGDVKVQIKVKAPKLGKRKIDVRSKVISSAGGDEFVVAEILGTDGGTVGVALDLIGGPGASIAGSGVQIPGGALALPTAVVVATAAPVSTKKGNEIGAGPSVFFGPEGQKFASDVTLTIPLDVESFEGDFSELQVFTRDGRGKVTLVPGPYDVNETDGTVSFPSRHFSSYRAFKPGSGNALFSGAWRLSPNPAPGVRLYFQIFETGQVNFFSVDNNLELCFFAADEFEVGTDLSEFFDIQTGDLVFPGADQRYVAVPPSELPDPQDCELIDTE